jgi:hypothetical protein
MNSFMEKQMNANYAFKKGKVEKYHSAVQTVQPANKIDNDKDNFIDLPLLTTISNLQQTQLRKRKLIGVGHLK